MTSKLVEKGTDAATHRRNVKLEVEVLYFNVTTEKIANTQLSVY